MHPIDVHLNAKELQRVQQPLPSTQHPLNELGSDIMSILHPKLSKSKVHFPFELHAPKKLKPMQLAPHS